MKLFYITMQFPAPSEVFAALDVKQLLNNNIDISVHSLKRPHKSNDKMMAERDLLGLKVTHNSINASISGFFFGIKNPLKASKLLLYTFWYNFKKPYHLLVSLIIFLRILQLYDGIIKEKPDVVHLFWGHYPSLLGYLVLKESPNVVLSLFIGAYDLSANYGLSLPVIRGADIVWTHSNYNLCEIKKKGRKKRTIVCYRGIDVALVESFNNLSKIDGKIVTVGRLIKSKQFSTVIEIFAVLYKLLPHLKLFIIGDGSEERYLKKLCRTLNIEDAVKFLGHVPHKIVLHEMAESEFFIFMSAKDSERLPNVVKEAMMSKCICIVSKTPGIEELVIDGTNGYVVDSNDIIAVVNRVIETYSNREKMNDIGYAAVERIRSNFDVQKQMLFYIDYWRKLIK